jgi:CRISPR/Cas system-associated exonuclease Cas4 (RecB family)
LNGYKVLFSELVKTSSISFQGEPLEGLQIMGLLETRSLDFENVILLSANEGSVPKTTTPQSFIPWDLKNYFGLPGRKEQDALYAYYFYRLIQRATNISFVYTSHSGKDLKSAEASRYLRQLEYYNEKGDTSFSITGFQSKLDHHPKPIAEVKIMRNDFYKEKLLGKFKKGLSPTALTSYLNCPLDFYFKYILGLQESDEIDEEMGADVIGNIIHKVLELLYEPYIGKAPDFGSIRDKLDTTLKQVIQEHMKNRWLKTGINKMNIQIIETLLNKFLSMDEDFIEKQLALGHSFEIVNVEEVLSREFSFDIEGEEIDVKLRGYADRIDKINDHLRIIDYKTGKVDKLNNVEISKVFKDGSWSKALQLLMYQAMYDNFQNDDVEVGIVGFRDLAKYVQSIKLKKTDEENVASLFNQGIKDLITHMMNNEEEIMHNPKSRWCKFCEVH